MPSPTILLSPEPSPSLTRRLRHAGATVLVLPDLHDLTPDDPQLLALRQDPRNLIVAAPYYPRAAFWLLARLNMPGRRADLPDPANANPADHAAPAARASHRKITCIDTTGMTETVLLARLLSTAEIPQPATASAPDDAADASPKTLPPPDASSLAWHPVIDFDRCIHCLQCVEFCLFGVFDAKDDAGDDARAAVIAPQKCKPGCPACARVCPTAAIIFPKFHARGPIAGDDDGRPERFDGPAARHAARPDVEAFRRAHGLQPPPQTPVQLNIPATPAAASTKKPDDTPAVEKLIDDLEAFES